MPVGERVAGVGEIGADEVQVFLGEVAQVPGDLGVGRLAEVVVEVGGGQYLLQGGEDAVAGGGQFGQRNGRLVGGGGLADGLGEVGDGGAERGVTGGAGVGVEVLDAVTWYPSAQRRATAPVDKRASSSRLRPVGARW
ncbi:hypothetical protein ACFWN1_05460 [Streptomyces sp. NPDC058459]|uniref:hypothetical protein n=1 Tax=Streptomyces sp. NPDC058459 TaxID=3346508 RepID=UPI003665434D